MGIAPGDHGLNGFLDAYDPETGERLWRWHAIPKPGEPGNETWAGDSWKTGGGDTWLTGSYDPELNLIYWGIGNPAPDFDGDVRKGDNLYTESMVALDADTGKLKWYFQFTPHDVHDWDAVEIPVLVDAPFHGQRRKLLVQANRNGFYYVLDRTNGKFLHGTPFINQLNWATGLTPEGRPIRVPECHSHDSGYTNMSGHGGRHELALARLQSRYRPVLCGRDGRLRHQLQIARHVPSRRCARSWPPATSKIRKSRGRRTCARSDLTTGKLKWEYKQIGSRRYGAGLLSTAGGLVFAGDDQGVFTALDAKTGKALWHFNTGQQITASPMAYSFKGKQYIAVAAGSNVVSFAPHQKR